MSEQNFISKHFFEGFETLLTKISTGEITQDLLNILALLGVLLWIYFGFKIYADAKVRFKLNIFLEALFLIVGVITGPIGLILYHMARPRYTPEELDFIKTEHKFYYHQASKVRDCIHCQSYVLEGHTYCTNCGVQNRFACSSCGSLTDHDDNWCFTCGLELNNGHLAKQAIRKMGFAVKKVVEPETVSIVDTVDDTQLKPDVSAKVKTSMAKGKTVLKAVASKSKNSLVKVFDFGANIRSAIQKNVKKELFVKKTTTEKPQEIEKTTKAENKLPTIKETIAVVENTNNDTQSKAPVAASQPKQDFNKQNKKSKKQKKKKFFLKNKLQSKVSA